MKSCYSHQLSGRRDVIKRKNVGFRVRQISKLTDYLCGFIQVTHSGFRSAGQEGGSEEGMNEGAPVSLLCRLAKNMNTTTNGLKATFPFMVN